ncbi:hypothetical protein [Azovibrio restrictus]|uniref:hypothetical protein n=1 Tax=Azovibrio restrictus TaxID=146938 RepID=UPI00047D38B5|nr:hypothetical protein [Azovibrio restrictus]
MSELPVAAAIAVGSWIAVPGGSWSPTQEEITAVRAQLAPHVKQIATKQHLILEKWSNYSFQYQGQLEGSSKVIYINAFCIPPPPYTQTRFVIFFDGGTCFFQAKYLPKNKSFIQVTFNGKA